MMFAFSALPIMIAIGAAVEYSRMTSARSDLRQAIDAAALETATDVATKLRAGVVMTNDQVFAKFDAAVRARASGQASFNGGAELTASSATYTYANGAIGIQAAGAARVPAGLGMVFGMSSYNVHSNATVRQQIAPFVNVSLVLDASPSMAVAATPAEIATFASLTAGLAGGACAFACHDLFYGDNYYDIARANGIRLRFDVMKQAAIDFINAANARNLGANQLAFTAYTFGATTSQRVAQTTNAAMVASAIASLEFDKMSQVAPTLPGGTIGNSPLEHYPDTDYAQLFRALDTAVPASGAGLNASTRQQLVILVTDGVSHTPVPYNAAFGYTYDYLMLAPNNLPTYSTGNNAGRFTAPIDPAVCSALKQRGVRVAVLNTPYYPMPASISDGYNTLVRYNAPPQAVADNLRACASSPDLYAEAQSAADIYPALLSLFTQGATVARLVR